LDYAGFNTTLAAQVCAEPTSGVGVDGAGNEFEFTLAAVKTWCEACVHAIDGQVDDLTAVRLAQANVAAMGPFDWVCLVLATVVVALTIGGELKVSPICAVRPFTTESARDCRHLI
jgi:hypothetical protein